MTDVAIPDEGRDEETGKFVQGNRFWEKAIQNFSKHGPDPQVKDSEQLLEMASGYFADITDNPLLEEKVFNSPSQEVLLDDDGYMILGEDDKPLTKLNEVTTHNTPRMRPMTLVGLCNWIGINERTWRKWREAREDLSDAIALIEQIIYQQKFEGAASGFLNHNIIARDLGLAEAREVSGPGGGPIAVDAEWNNLEIARRLAFVLARAVQDQKEVNALQGETIEGEITDE